ncbi:MAG: discoidin domain-containing protein, partial [Spirochaetales bacterium]|nr:discoidin domain-containing protein [Spirochaetales bacterium]
MKKIKGSFVIATLLVAMLFTGCEIGGFVSNDGNEADSTKTVISDVTATASSDDGNEPSNTLDGDLDTRWSAEGDGEYITFDLGSSQTVTDVQIAFYKGDDRTADFEIWAGDSTSELSQILDLTTTSGDTEALENYDVSDVTTQYVRIVCYGNSSNDWNSITEVQLEDNSGDDSVTDDGTTDDSTDDTTTTEEGELTISDVDASSNDGNVAANTIDDDYDTRWSAEGDGEYITYDLGDEQTVGSIKIAFYKGDSRNAYFYVQAGTSLTDLSSVTESLSSSGSSTDLEHFDLDDVSARYVRIVGEGNSDNSWNSITEVEIWSDGYDPESTTDDGTTDDGSDDSTEDLDLPEDPTGGVYPSDLMENYNQWKITYPDGTEDKTLYQESNEYFYVNDEGDGIVFYAPISEDNGTTPNSDNIRCELREREEDGSSDIYWTTDGTHRVYSKQAITHLPIVKDELVATQIHGNKDDGIDDALVLRLEGSHLFLCFNGGDLRDDITIKTDYELGTVHEILFEVIDGVHYVYYSEDGNLQTAYAAGEADEYLVKDGDNDYVMYIDYDEAYFKVGNYTQ